MLTKEDICALLDEGDQQQEVDQYLNVIKYNSLLLDIGSLLAILSHPKSTPSLIATALNTCGKMIQELAKTISSSKTIGTDPLKRKLADLKQNHKIVLLALEKHACHMSPIEIARSYWGLGYMEIHWDTMTQYQQSILVNNLVHKANEMPLKNLINALWALTHLKFPWKKLRKELQQRLLDRISEDKSPISLETMNIFLSTAARYGILWSDLNEQLSAKLLHTLKASEHIIPLSRIPTFLWAFARMDITLSSKTNVLIINLFKIYSQACMHSDSLKEGHQQMIMAYYYFENKVPGLSFRNRKYIERHIYDTKSTSITQERITRQIKYALKASAGAFDDKDWIDEALIYGFRVDTLLPRYAIVLEIDGPHHAQWQQQLTDRFQNNILAERGYTTIRVCISTWDRLNQKSRHEFINNIVAAIIRPTQYKRAQRSVAVTPGLRLELDMPAQAIEVILSNQALVDSILGNAREINAQDIVCSLGALARRNIHWKDLSSRLISIFQKNLYHDVCEMSKGEIVDTLCVLGQLNAGWTGLKKPLQDKLLLSLGVNLPNMVSEEIFLCLEGLQQLNLSWKSLPIRLKEKFASTVVEKTSDTKAINFKKTFFALTRLMFTWQDLNEQQQTNLIKALVEDIPLMNAESIADILYTLAELRIPKTHGAAALINRLFSRLQTIDTPTSLYPDKKQQITQAYYFFKPCMSASHFTVKHYEEASSLAIVNSTTKFNQKSCTALASDALEKKQPTVVNINPHDENTHPLGYTSSKSQYQLPIKQFGLFEARAKVDARRSSSPLSPQSSTSTSSQGNALNMFGPDR